MPELSIDHEICTNCGGCIEMCPSGVFSRETPDTGPQPVRTRFCISCGQCVSICPVNAVTHGDFPDGTITKISKKSVPSVNQVFELLKSRRSVRAFKKKKVNKADLEQILEAARYAPSSTNTQSTEYIVITDPEVLDRISELTVLFLEDVIRKFENKISKVMLAFTAGPSHRGAARMIPGFKLISQAYHEGYDPILRNAPALIVFHGRKSVAMSDANSNLALQNSTLMTHAMGLGAFYCGFVVAACRRDSAITELLEIPARNEVHGTLAVGHPKFVHKNWIERKEPRVKWF